MVKRVFAIIGVVLGAVTAFVGSVFGVMALMGKFKTPVVYPASLYFEETDVLFIADDSNEDKLYSFVISASSSNPEHEVNQKSCLLTISQGAELITLWDKEKNAKLPGNKLSGYWVECNEEIYFKIKKTADVEDNELNKDENRGKVVITARTANEQQQTQQPLNIWIDREVSSLQLNHDGSVFVYDEQQITISVDSKLYLNTENSFKTFSELSRKPVGYLDNKIVEVYLNKDKMNLGAWGYSHSILLTPQALSDSRIAEFIKYDSDKKALYLSPKLNKEYYFTIAVFPTYQAKIDFENEFPDANVSDRLSRMIKREIKVVAENTTINSVDIGADSVNLFLYSNGDTITVNDAGEGTNNNNLRIYMMDDKGYESTVRFSGIQLANIQNVDKNQIETFVASDKSSVKVADVNDSDIKFATYGGKEIKIGNCKLVDHIENNGKNYYSQNGVAVYNKSENKFYLLSTGSYFDFYSVDSNYYSLNNDFVEVTLKPGHENKEDDKTWNIIAKTIPSESTFMMGLVVNSNGTYCVDAVPVLVDEIELKFNTPSVMSQSLNTVIGDDITYDEVAFDKIITNVSGSYNSLAFVLTNPDDAEYIKHVDIPKSDNSGSLYIVGEIAGGQFRNVISFNKIVPQDKTITLTLCQFRNDYQQSLSAFILLANTNSEINVGKYVLISSTSYSISQKLDVQNVDVEIVSGSVTETYEATTDNVINLKSRQLTALHDYYGDALISRLQTNNLNVSITALSAYEESNVKVGISITYKVDTYVGTAMISTKSPIGEYNLVAITAKSASPNGIKFTIDGQEIELKDNETDAPIIKVDVTYNIGYIYAYTFNSGANRIANPSEFFNITQGPVFAGVYESDYSGTKHDISYNTAGANSDAITLTNNGDYKAITINKVLGEGEYCVVQVSIRSTIRYIKFKIVSNLTFVSNGNTESGKEIKATEIKMSGYAGFYQKVAEPTVADFGEYYVFDNVLKIMNKAEGSFDRTADYYKKESIQINATYVTISDLRITKISGISKDYTVDNGVYKDAEGKTILTITNDATDGWKFVKGQDYAFQPINLEFNLITLFNIVAVKWQLTNNISINLNNAWSANNYRLYQGTEILIYEINPSENSPLIIVQADDGNGISGSVHCDKTNSSTIIDTKKYKFENLGIHTIYINIGGVQNPFVFNVVPNIVATPKSDLTLESGTEYSVGAIFDSIQKYKTEDTYNNPYSSADLEPCDINGSVILIEDRECSIDNGKVTIPAKTELATSKTVTVVLKNSDVPIKEFSAKLENSIKIKYKTGAIINGTDYTATLYANTEYQFSDLFEGAGLTLKYIQINGRQYNAVSGTVIIGNLSDIISNPTIIFGFEAGGAEYTYLSDGADDNGMVVDFTVSPYIPSHVDGYNEKSILTKQEFNLSTGVYNFNEAISDAKIKSVRVKKIIYNGVESIELGDNVTSYPGNGYSLTIVDGVATIFFDDFEGENRDFVVVYYIVYADQGGDDGDDSNNIIYENCLASLKVFNRQVAVLTYPMGTDDFEVNASELTVKPGFNDVLPTTLDYEPIILKSTQITTIDFASNLDYTNTCRAKVENLNDGSFDYEFTILPVAYTNSPFKTVFNNLTVNGTKVTFPSVTSMNGYITFKIITESGNYAYYTIYVYCSDVINSNNNLNVNYSNNTNQNMTFYNILTIDEDQFKSTFGLEYATIQNNFYLYVVDSYSLTENGADYSGVEISGKANLRNTCVYSSIGGKTHDTTITTSTKYQTIKCLAVYKAGAGIYCFGTITFYIQPQVREELNSQTGIEEKYQYKQSISGVNNGEYKKTLSANTMGAIANPFKVAGATLSKIVVDNNHNGVVSGGTSLTISKYTTQEITFNAYYVYGNDLVVKVTYTYEATTIPTSIPQVTLGSFDGTKFVNDLDLSNIDGEGGSALGNYTGEISINNITLLTSVENSNPSTLYSASGSMPEIKYYYNNTSKSFHLVFTQDTNNYTFDLSIVCSNLLDDEGSNATITLPIYLKHGIDMTYTGSGSNSGNRLVSTLNTSSPYGSTVGSSIDITYTNDDINKVYTYTIGTDGTIIIRTSMESVLDLVVPEEKWGYVKYTGTTTLKGYNYNKDEALKINYIRYNSTDNTSIEFVHWANENAPIDLGIRVTVDSKEFNFANNTLYASIRRTYSALVPVYVETGANGQRANHENILGIENISDIIKDEYDPSLAERKSGEQIGTTGKYTYNSTLFTNLFTGENAKFVLQNLSNSVVSGTAVNFATMGFNDPYNINYIDLEEAIKSLGEARIWSGDKLYLKSSSTENLIAYLSISNQAGISGVDYAYQVMKTGDELDGIDFANTTGYKGETTNNDYISYTVKKNANNSYTDFEVVGSLKDKENGNIFKLRYSNNNPIIAIDDNNIIDNVVDLSSWTLIGDGDIKLYSKDGKYCVFKNGGCLSKTIFTAYKITSEGYTFYVVYVWDADNYVYAKLAEKETTDEQIKLSIIMTGTTADIKMDKGTKLDLVFFNYNITPIYGDENHEDSIVATNTIDLKDKITNVDSLTLRLITNDNKSYFTYSNGTRTETIYITADTVDELFAYDLANKKITTENVGQTVKLCLTFNVQTSEGMIVREVQYWFRIEPNYQFATNGDVPSGAKAFTTYFSLSKAKYDSQNELTDGDTFPLIVKFDEDKEATGSNVENGNNGILSYALYNKAGDKFDSSHTNVNIAIKSMSKIDSAYYNEYIEVSKDKITFKQDYFGNITLYLRVNTQYGTYQAEWTITVQGIVSLDYKLADYNGSALLNGNNAFNSGSEQAVINNVGSNNGTGIIMKNNATNVNVRANIKYKTVPVLGTTLDAEAIMSDESTEAQIIKENEDLTNQTSLKIALPIVPVSAISSEVRYYVVVKIEVTYMGLTYHRYVVYEVKNTINITKNNANICVGTLTDAKLKLFNYVETITYTGGSIAITYDVESKEFKTIYDSEELTSTDGNKFYDKSTPADLKLTIERDVKTIKFGEETEGKNITIQGISTADSLFTTPFNNIVEYAKYIQGIDHIKFAEKGNKFKYTLKNNTDTPGTIIIDFNENKTTGTLFNNEMIDTLLVVGKDGKPLDQINPYSVNNTSGFKLYSNKSISPYTTEKLKVSKVFDTDDDYEIIGVFDTASEATFIKWVSGATSCTYSNIKTYSIESAIYTLYSITYIGIGNGGSDWYSIEDTFYALQSSTADLLYVNYRGLGGTSYVTVSYEEGKDSVLPISNVLKRWCMEEDPEHPGKYALQQDTKLSGVGGGTTEDEINKEFGKLVAYKNANPTASYLEVKYTLTLYTLTFGSQTRSLNVRFRLPDNPTLLATYNASNTSPSGFTLLGNSETYNATNFKFDGAITKVELDETYLESGDALNIINIKTDAVDTFFNGSTQNLLKISAKLILSDGSTIDFDVIIVKKTAA